ncbi:MAG: GNAT family N-acetyltransferase [Patescibacteria group bacterium]
MEIRPVKWLDWRKGLFETLETLMPVGVFTSAWRTEVITKMEANPDQTIFVAEENGKVVGAATLIIERTFFHGGTSFAYITHVATRKELPDQYRQTLRKALIDHLTKEAQERHCYQVRIIYHEN